MAGLVGWLPNSRESVPSDTEALQRECCSRLSYHAAETCTRWEDLGAFVAQISLRNPSSRLGLSQRTPGRTLLLLDGEAEPVALWNEIRERVDRLPEPGGSTTDLRTRLEALHGVLAEDLDRLDGSFVAVLIDRPTRTVILLNDPFASRPLYTMTTSEGFAFATQLDCLLALPGASRRLDPIAVSQFVGFQRTLGEQSMIEGVRAVKGGSIVLASSEGSEERSYWTPKFRHQDRKPPRAAELAECLVDALHRRLPDTESIGILLSGGLDSRVVLAADRQQKISVALTVGDVRNREVAVAAQVASSRACRHVFLKREPHHYADLFPVAVRMSDGGWRFDHAHFLGMEGAIQREVDAVFHGHGLDYTFQGLYLPKAHRSILGRDVGIPQLIRLRSDEMGTQLLKRLKNSTAHHQPERLLSPGFRETYARLLTESVEALLKAVAAGSSNLYDVWDLFVLHSLSKHFTHLHFASLRHFLQERSLITDRPLFDLYLRTPPQARVSGALLRQALTLLSPVLASIPSANTGFRASMHPSLSLLGSLGRRAVRKAARLGRPRPSGSATGQGSWPQKGRLIQQDTRLQRVLREALKCLPEGLFSRPELLQRLEDHVSGRRDSADVLYTLATLGGWCERNRIRS